VNAAGTDIRPEDAELAITRALTSCGTNVGTWGPLSVSTTQYEGLGYANRGSIDSYYSTSTFHVVNFSLPSSFTVTPVGAAPVVVAVSSTDTAPAGFANTNITNLNSSTLALYLDGTIGYTRDALTPGNTQTTAQNKATTVILREPLSGTYNTLEYSIPNTLRFQTSQDVGQEQPTATKNCNGTVPEWNAEGTSMATLVSGAVRNRAIGTGEEIKALFGTGGYTAPEDGLGYAFWSVANFAPAASSTSTVKYLTVDGVDPIQTTYTGGTIPTTSTELESVTLQHVKDGTYPIWSLLRLVTTSSSASTYAGYLATAAQSYVSFGTSTSQPDFVPYSSLAVEHSHFLQSGISPQNGVGGTYTEAGGDVGGVVIPVQADKDYVTDTGVTTGYVNRRM
jgi:hypothetical protein